MNARESQKKNGQMREQPRAPAMINEGWRLRGTSAYHVIVSIGILGQRQSEWDSLGQSCSIQVGEEGTHGEAVAAAAGARLAWSVMEG